MYTQNTLINLREREGGKTGTALNAFMVTPSHNTKNQSVLTKIDRILLLPYKTPNPSSLPSLLHFPKTIFLAFSFIFSHFLFRFSYGQTSPGAPRIRRYFPRPRHLLRLPRNGASKRQVEEREEINGQLPPCKYPGYHLPPHG